MLIDINSYVGHWPFKQLKFNTCATRLDVMNKYGVTLSVVSNMNGIFYKNTQPANEELYSELKSESRFSGRFIPFAVINPIYAGWRDDLEECVTKMGMRGVRVFPQYHDYGITEPALLELVKVARDRGLPVAIDIRMVDSRQRSWLDIPLYDYNAAVKKDIISKEWSLQNIVPLVREIPDAKYMILNLANSIDLNTGDLELFRKADILFDTSGRVLMAANSLGELVNRFGKGKFAFGTHSPVLDYLTALLRIESMSGGGEDDETKELLRSGNAKRFLGL
jgi:uncharacterized protein